MYSQVEALFRNFHTRRTIRLDKELSKRKRKALSKSTEPADASLQAQEEERSSVDTESTRNSDSEEDNEESVDCFIYEDYVYSPIACFLDWRRRKILAQFAC